MWGERAVGLEGRWKFSKKEETLEMKEYIYIFYICSYIVFIKNDPAVLFL